MRTSSSPSHRVAFGLVALTGLFVTITAQAAQLEEKRDVGNEGDKRYAGKTKPGDIPGKEGSDTKVRLVAAEDEPNAVGVTIWYRVLDRQAKTTNETGDTF